MYVASVYALAVALIAAFALGVYIGTTGKLLVVKHEVKIDATDHLSQMLDELTLRVDKLAEIAKGLPSKKGR